MGEWADYAYKKFHSESNTKRVQEEVELQRHSKIVAGAEKRWKELLKFVVSETEDFNKRMERQFLTVRTSDDYFEIDAPRSTLKASIDFRVPELRYEYGTPGGYGRDATDESGEFGFVRDNDVVTFNQESSGQLSVERVGAELLNRLVV